jgi:hypothetical protein
MLTTERSVGYALVGEALRLRFCLDVNVGTCERWEMRRCKHWWDATTKTRRV